MNKVISMADRKTQAVSKEIKTNLGAFESEAERVRRIYAERGGPLIGWLLDEARRREHGLSAMSRELGVTYGYISQLRSGLRSTERLSQEMAESCAQYLGVPTIAVKVICGQISIRDFVAPQDSEERCIDRAIARMMDDPHVRKTIPVDLAALSPEGKKAVAILFAETTHFDLFGAQGLPQMVQYLQRAVINHGEAELEALNGHSDTSVAGG